VSHAPTNIVFKPLLGAPGWPYFDARI